MKQEMYAHIHQVEQNHWWYAARRKIIFDWALAILEKRSLPRIIDIGCGTGLNLLHLGVANHQDAVGLDISPEALSFCRSRGLSRLLCGDAMRLPLRHGSFDVLLALDLLEHLPDDARALDEFVDLLRPGGALIAFVPAFQFLWGLQDEVSRHHRRYTATEIRTKLRGAGLVVEKLTYVNLLLFPLIWAGRLALRVSGYRTEAVSENELHPQWSNSLLEAIFAAERPLLQRFYLPFGVSILCIARKPALGECR